MARDWRVVSGIPTNLIQSATPPRMPRPFIDFGVSGKVQTRDTVQRGRTWQETYQTMAGITPAFRKLMAAIGQAWHQGETFEIEHPTFNGLTPGSTLSNSPTINGAGQAGTTLTITATTGTILAGSVVKIGADNILYDVVEDVADSATTIEINPPILVGNEPADAAAIAFTGVKFNAAIHQALDLPFVSGGTAFAGLTLNWREVP